jgi:hypothetical protein
MSIRCCGIVVWILAGLQCTASGQSSSGQNSPAEASGDATTRTAPAPALSSMAGVEVEGSASDTNSSLPQMPALLGGPAISASFISELERSNYLRAGLNIGAAYDDNPLLLSSGAASNTSESIFPNVRIEASSSRMRWTLGYAGGLTVNQKFTSQNEGSHSLIFDSQYRLSPHVNLRIAENFSLTTGFFDAGNGTDVVTGSGVPNASLITPLSTQRTSTTTVEANYHFALNDLVGASGSFNDLHFTNVPAGTLLTNSQTASGSAFWLHKLSRLDWGGLTYRFDRITFNPSGGETRVHSFYAINTLNLSSRVTLTGFVGPQYSDNEGLAPGAEVPTQSKNRSFAGGAEGAWRNQLTGVAAGYSCSTSDGGGILGAVRSQNVHGTFRREFVRGWAVALTGVHGTNRSLTVPSTASANSINLTTGGISLDHNVAKSLGLHVGYTHDFQKQFGLSATGQTGAAPTLDTHRNRVFVTLSYQWAKPLGM